METVILKKDKMTEQERRRNLLGLLEQLPGDIDAYIQNKNNPMLTGAETALEFSRRKIRLDLLAFKRYEDICKELYTDEEWKTVDSHMEGIRKYFFDKKMKSKEFSYGINFEISLSRLDLYIEILKIKILATSY